MRVAGDGETTVAELRGRIREFLRKRRWAKYHTPRMLAEAISIESAELLEAVLWRADDEVRRLLSEGKFKDAIVEEMADVIIYSLSLANALGADVSRAVLGKIKKNEERYPVNVYKGRAYAEFTRQERIRRLVKTLRRKE